MNRDEFLGIFFCWSVEPQLTRWTPLMLPCVLGHFFSGYNANGSLPFLNLILLDLLFP